MNKRLDGGFFAAYGPATLENGYNIIPIEPGAKRPYRHIENWSQIDANQNTLKRWLSENCGQGGLGINARTTPAVDIDVLDKEVAAHMRDWCLENVGPAPVRIGKAPKQLLMYRTDEPFRKVTSKKYRDEWNDTHRVEILGDGQQFVAFHIHPDTARPYRWADDSGSPLDIPHSDLTTVSANDARRICEEFERTAEEAGWEEVAGGTSRLSSANVDRDDPFAADKLGINIDNDELARRLMLVPGADEYEVWVQVGMALFHQFEGDYAGLDMWVEWSAMSEKFEERACTDKWKSFDIRSKNREPITARYILAKAKEAAETASEETMLELRDVIGAATDVKEWKAAVKKAKSAEIDALARAELAELAKNVYQRITGVRVPIQEVRKAMAYELNSDDMPVWCRNWVYDTDDDKFFNTDNKVMVSRQGFDSLNDRKALTKKDILEGRTRPGAAASELALNLYRIPTIHGRMYAPGRDPVFPYAGRTMGNTYPEHQVPNLPEKVRPIDKKNIRRVEAHIGHLLGCAREQRLLMSWLAYVVQNPGKRVNWAIILQGTEGDGKSFFLFLLRAVMGIPNVAMLNASSFKGDFTGWAVGQCVAGVEELRLQGENRYDILNKIKPFITNDVVEIHAKGKTQFNAENTTNYFGLTNFRDALPLNENDRRYFVLFSRWQSREALSQFNEENPAYYSELYAALDESAPALRKWFLDHQLDDEFAPRGNAPWTEAHDIMVQAAMPDDLKAINEIVDSNAHADICDELLNITKLTDEMNSIGVHVPMTRGLKTTLSRAGWFPLNGQVRLDGDDSPRARLYSKTPEKFTVDGTLTGKPNPSTIRAFIQKRAARVKTPDPFDDEL